MTLRILAVLAFLTLPLGCSTGRGLKEARPCDFDSIGLDEGDALAKRLFLTGTCHFRNERYGEAYAQWKALRSLEDMHEGYDYLRVDALNNLGFLLFLGQGVRKDQDRALEYWHAAALMGHDESEYHLCHAYADNRQPTFNKSRAIQHCRRAELIYSDPRRPSGGEELENTLNNIKAYIEWLEGR